MALAGIQAKKLFYHHHHHHHHHHHYFSYLLRREKTQVLLGLIWSHSPWCCIPNSALISFPDRLRQQEIWVRDLLGPDETVYCVHVGEMSVIIL